MMGQRNMSRKPQGWLVEKIFGEEEDCEEVNAPDEAENVADFARHGAPFAPGTGGMRLRGMRRSSREVFR